MSEPRIEDGKGAWPVRAMIEINHDKVTEDTGLCVALARYAASGSQRDAEALEKYGLTVIGMRHHSGRYIVDGVHDGFPLQRLGRSS